MNARFQHRSDPRGTPPGHLHDDTIDAGAQVIPGSACCCPASPVVRVTMPATAVRRHSTDLLLCGHHYRVSRETLAAANATVTVLPVREGSTPCALLPDLPRLASTSPGGSPAV